MNLELKQEANGFKFTDPLLNHKYKLAKQTLNEMIVNSDSNGVTFVGIRTLANNTGKSTPTIQKHLEILEELNIVTILNIVGSFGKKNHRQISFDNVQVDVQPNVQVDVQPNVQVDVQPNVQVTYTEDKLSEENIREGTTTPLRSAEDEAFFETMWKGYTLDFINKESGRTDNNKAAARKSFKAIMKCTFKGVPKQDMHEFLEDYVKDEMELKDPKFCKSLQNLMKRDNVQNYLDKLQG